ncbi:phage holin family protein [Hydrogenophaga sp.]|uniref:phage holin family protein n=1 Tax=Hydrogenophaga sp. TaxID=1904254 RepID=UPI003F71497E
MSRFNHAHAAEPHGAGRLASLGALLGGLFSELPGLVSDRVELLSLELQRAGLALLHIACLGLALTVLGMAGWLLVWALVLVGLVAAGLSWAVALAVALLVHVLLGWWAVNRIRRLLPTLGLPATRRQLTFRAPTPPDEALDEDRHVPQTAH